MKLCGEKNLQRAKEFYNKRLDKICGKRNIKE